MRRDSGKREGEGNRAVDSQAMFPVFSINWNHQMQRRSWYSCVCFHMYFCEQSSNWFASELVSDNTKYDEPYCTCEGGKGMCKEKG